MTAGQLLSVSEEVSRLVDAVDRLHGFVENGGLAHAVGVNDQTTTDAIAGHRRAGNDEVANAITRATQLVQAADASADEALNELERTYYDGVETGALAAAHRLERPPPHAATPDDVDAQARLWRDLILRWSLVPEGDTRVANRLHDEAGRLRTLLLATAEGQQTLEQFIDDEHEAVRINAATALFKERELPAARRYLEDLAESDSPNAMSAQIVLGIY